MAWRIHATPTWVLLGALACFAACANGVASDPDDPTVVDAATDVQAADAGILPGDTAEVAEDVGAPDAPMLEDFADVPDASDAPDAPDIPDASDLDAPDAPDAADVVEFPTVIVAVETRLSASTVRAGDSVFVACDGLDAAGNRVRLPDDTTITFVVAPSDSMLPGDAVGEFIGRRVGNATLACRLPTLGLIDDTPEDIAIVPGVPYTITTALDRVVMTAGESVSASCRAFDVFGNEVTDASFRLVPTPFGEGVNVFGTRAVIERAGQYEMACSLEGAVELVSVLLEVRPALPASLTLGLQPDRLLYGIGEVVTLRWTVLDRFGNRVPGAPVAFGSLPSLPTFGQARFRFDREGVFRLSATVGRPTLTGEPLVASVEVTVNDTGPEIRCDAPFDGEMVDIAPGERLVVQGQVADAGGVAAVTVNGREARLFPGGTFEAEVPVRFGVNFLEIDAVDAFGVGNRRVCAFLASDTWVAPDAFLGDAIVLDLAAAAFDDGNRCDGLDSITDILFAVINSTGLTAQLDAALRAADPLYPETCVVDAWLFCAVSFGLNYRSLRVDGPNDTAVTLVDGGLRVAVTVRDVELGLRIRGTFGTSGTINVDRLGIAMVFDLGLSAGRPRVALRSLDGVDVGGIDSDFSGITGFILDLVVDLFEGTIRNLVRDELSDFVVENFSEILDDLVANLDIESLGATFDVPRLDGEGAVGVGFGVQFSSVQVTREQATFGLASRFAGDVVRSDTLGAPIAALPTADSAALPRTVRAAVDYGLLNQVLHALWQGGFFDVALGDALLGDAALDGVALDVSAGLPLVVVGTATDAIEVHIGAWEVALDYPGLFVEPLRVRLGAVATARVVLVDDTSIDFDGLALTEFYFDPVDVALEPETRDVLDALFRRVLQSALDTALEGALPALPVPAFELPASVAAFGLPAGAYLGLVDAALQLTERRFVLLGNFGTR
jgi:hypothetical protein